MTRIVRQGGGRSTSGDAWQQEFRQFAWNIAGALMKPKGSVKPKAPAGRRGSPRKAGAR